MTRNATEAPHIPVLQKDAVLERVNQEIYLREAALCTASLKYLLKAVWHILEPGTPFIDGWVIDAICEHLEAITRGEIRKLVIAVPPRFAKSTVSSVVWPLWDWLHIPTDRFLHASYSLDLSTRDNRRKRELINEEWWQHRFGDVFQLAHDQQQKRLFENTEKGYQMAVAVRSAITGQGGSKNIVDDAHDARKAESKTDREATVRWFRTVWTNRLNNQEKDAMLVIGQRVHNKDVIGYILAERPDWDALILPLQYEPSRHCTTSIGWKDPRTVEGELLFPERFSEETMKGLKKDVGPYGFASQYQQRPVPDEGAKFRREWFRQYVDDGKHYTLIKADKEEQVMQSQCTRFGMSDFAISLKQSADFTVFAAFAVTPNKDIVVLDVLRGHFDDPEIMKQIVIFYKKNSLSYMVIETVAFQLSIFQRAKKTGLAFKEFRPVADKMIRATTASVLYQAEQIFHPVQAHWLADWEDELLSFPMGEHDDQVDCISGAAIQLEENGMHTQLDMLKAMTESRTTILKNRGWQER